MEYKLKNGKTVIIREPNIKDAQAIINIIKTADSETKFLSRNPHEFNTTVNQEEIFIKNLHKDNNKKLYIAEYDNNIIGTCSVGLVSTQERYRHRAEVTFVILKDYCGIGIGGKLMQNCINWCMTKNITQIELDVVTNNDRAINMYKNFGFKKVGIIPKAMQYPDGSFADKQIMVLEL